MNKNRILSGIISTLLLSGGLAQADDDQPETTLPAALQQTIDSKYPGAVLDSIDLEVHLGMPVYEIELYHDGRELEIDALADGSLISIETDTRIELIPEGVKAQIPSDLNLRKIDVSKIQILRSFDGSPTPRIVYLLESKDREWLLQEGPAASQAQHNGPVEAVTAAPVPETGAPSVTTETTAAIIPIKDLKRGMPVTLRGEVMRIRDEDEFVLQDSSGAIEIYTGRTRVPVSTGQIVTVIGFADDDTFPGMKPEIYATRILLPDGRNIQMQSYD